MPDLAFLVLPVDPHHDVIGDKIAGLESEVALFQVMEPMSHQEGDREMPDWLKQNKTKTR